MSYEKLLDGTFNLPIDVEDFFSVVPSSSKDNLPSFDLFLTSDQDIHILPALNFSGISDDYFENMYFSSTEYPNLVYFLKILAIAISKDNTKTNEKNYDIDNPEIIIKNIIENPNIDINIGESFSIVHDDNGGNQNETLLVSFDDNGAYLKINCMDGLRFRTFFGGGKKHRVRNALIAICYLIKHQIL